MRQAFSIYGFVAVCVGLVPIFLIDFASPPRLDNAGLLVVVITCELLGIRSLGRFEHAA